MVGETCLNEGLGCRGFQETSAIYKTAFSSLFSKMNDVKVVFKELKKENTIFVKLIAFLMWKRKSEKIFLML